MIYRIGLLVLVVLIAIALVSNPSSQPRWQNGWPKTAVGPASPVDTGSIVPAVAKIEQPLPNPVDMKDLMQRLHDFGGTLSYMQDGNVMSFVLTDKGTVELWEEAPGAMRAMYFEVWPDGTPTPGEMNVVNRDIFESARDRVLVEYGSRIRIRPAK